MASLESSTATDGSPLLLRALQSLSPPLTSRESCTVSNDLPLLQAPVALVPISFFLLLTSFEPRGASADILTPVELFLSLSVLSKASEICTALPRVALLVDVSETKLSDRPRVFCDVELERVSGRTTRSVTVVFWQDCGVGQGGTSELT